MRNGRPGNVALNQSLKSLIKIQAYQSDKNSNKNDYKYVYGYGYDLKTFQADTEAMEQFAKEISQNDKID